MKTGTVIHGTHRPQDLIPAFLDALKEISPAHYTGFITLPFRRVPAYVPAYVQDEGDDSAWWHSGDAQALLEDLTELLDEIAPEGHYFGAHPGDGSDFGFWPLAGEGGDEGRPPPAQLLRVVASFEITLPQLNAIARDGFGGAPGRLEVVIWEQPQGLRQQPPFLFDWSGEQLRVP